MNVRNLEAFVVVFDERSFSKAAKSLGTVQSNVSTRVRDLEAERRVLLFERRYRTVVPTQHGERMYCYARQVLAILETIKREIRPTVHDLT